jgi:hypothetical protein
MARTGNQGRVAAEQAAGRPNEIRKYLEKNDILPAGQ